jgi:hypothetical protein
MCGSTCFGCLPAHHQELTTALGASGFTVGEKRLERYQEHIRYTKNNDPQSAFAQHILNKQHEHGTINKIVKLLKPLKLHIHANPIWGIFHSITLPIQTTYYRTKPRWTESSHSAEHWHYTHITWHYFSINTSVLNTWTSSHSAMPAAGNDKRYVHIWHFLYMST